MMLTNLTLVSMWFSLAPLSAARAETTRGSLPAIVINTMQVVPLDPYLIDVLLRDLVGHDRMPSAYLVYLWLWRMTHGSGKMRAGASLQTIATATGLSKSAVQAAIRHLKHRQLIAAKRDGATVAPVYTVHQPWRRD
ncbi:MAG: helix-turn-helix domain-containing protein [Sphingomonadales bacterium]|nr:MAG: helix-turn-helix domain-containing protein [Sphingomonadales bacterium]